MPDRTVVLDETGLDYIEAVLSGFGQFHSGSDTVRIVFTDAENTPLARWDGAALVPLRPLPHAIGPQWEPQVRRSAAELTDWVAGRNVVAFPLDDLPTYGDRDAVTAKAADFDAVLLLVAVPRVSRPMLGQNRGPFGQLTLSAAGLVRAIEAFAAQLRVDLRVDVQVAVVPWPVGQPVAWADIAERLGVELQFPDSREVPLLELLSEWEVMLADEFPPESLAEIGRAIRGTPARGTVLLFTGLSGSGKSTIAKALAAQLADDGVGVTLLDGDEVRQHLSRGLGFDRAGRETNLDRIGYVAALVAKHGGIAIAAPIAPFAESRANIRAQAEHNGARFVLVYVSTPLEVCERRDRKGLYAQARAGKIADFTGISSPYEPPQDADLEIDASVVSVPDAVKLVRDCLGL